MTTIAVRDGIMCSDSQATRGDFIDNICTEKLFEVGGCIIGISGGVISAKKFVEWFSDTLEAAQAQEDYPFITVTPPEKLVETDFHCLVLYPEGQIYEFFGCDNVIEILTPYAAAGSGMFNALCAMDAGASAEEAVKVSIGRDPFSGGGIQIKTLQEVEKPLTEDDFKEMTKEEIIEALFPKTEPEVVSVEDEEFPANVGGLEKVVDDYCSEEDFVNNIATTNDRSFLEEAAKSLEIKFAKNIGIEKLRQRILASF